MRKFYFTKKRKREFQLTYDKIEELKRYISNMKIENDTYLKYCKIGEVEMNNRLINKFEQDLKELEDKGWIVDYPFSLNKC